jgi:hypothetical protein
MYTVKFIHVWDITRKFFIYSIMKFLSPRLIAKNAPSDITNTQNRNKTKRNDKIYI